MIASKRAHLSIREADICDGETPQTEVGLFFFFSSKIRFLHSILFLLPLLLQ